MLLMLLCLNTSSEAESAEVKSGMMLSERSSEGHMIIAHAKDNSQ